MADDNAMVRRQRLLADFGEFALRSENLDEILHEACRLVAEALGTARAKILEIQEGGQSFLVRAGIGWDPGIVGELRLPMGEQSSESYSITAGRPVIMRDIRAEDRFSVPEFMRAAGVVASVNAPILLPGGKAFGLLQADDTRPREFGQEDAEFLRTYTIILGPVIDRLLKLGQLRLAEERFRLTVETALDYAIFVTDRDDQITDWLPGAAAVFGWTAEEVAGRPGAVLFTPEDRAKGEPRKEVLTAMEHGWAPNIRWHLRKDGSRVFIEGSLRALHDEAGELRGFLKIGRDATDRRAAEERLRESEERFRQFGEASSDLIWMRDAATLGFEYLSPAFEPIYGRSREEQLADNTLESWAALVHADDREMVVQRLLSVRDGARANFEFRILRPPDGELRWIRNTDFPLPDQSGRVRRLAGIAKDVTEEKASAARLEVLVAELQHRGRNLLGVVSAVAGRTLGQVGPVEHFRSRLQALSRAQGLLSQSGSDTVEVGALIGAELEAYAQAEPPKVTINGPKVRLTSRQVQNFALALHELTTNAVKYGALKGEEGQLSVRWFIGQTGRGRRSLVLEWEETGYEVPPEAGRRGYGRELIEKALSYALRATTDYRLDAKGVRCRIELPLA
ncbi:PAS domain S-box protein [Roseomonas indoligenes]|uniref:histidine kinase n=1 Tax=Roseomonas indoligenes TaxID=2820811 RepID=A0A940S6J4_9PROT|nr:PAS domain S-box protein [Pararoseomonas indoligenes]MBP0492043.1 PAS domain S-box protein [Pararoseomonas indoligenes]